MARFKITTNKILFLFIVLFDIFFMYYYWSHDMLAYWLLLPIFILLLSYFRCFHYFVCYTYINRKNVNRALLANLIGFLFRLWFFSYLFMTLHFMTLLWIGIIGLIDFCITIYFIFTIYFMKSLLYFDINIPVDGWGIAEKVDAVGDAIPGL